MVHSLAMRLRGCLAVPLLLASCHDASRENPFDPALTPPVQLAVALDDTAGTASLTWTPYAGSAPFAEYRVLRQVKGLVAVDTLARIDEVRQTAYVDTSMAQHTAYVYRVAVANTGGFEIASTEQVTLPLQLPAVRIQAEFDSRTASAALAWNRYAGPGFRTCQVRRRTQELAPQVVFETRDSTVTSWVDRGLVGATEYFYRVVVLTERGEEVPSEEVSGAIHRLLATWPLELGSHAAVRLYAEPGDRLAALEYSVESYTAAYVIIPLRLHFFDSAGRRLEEQTLLDGTEPVVYYVRSIATALSPEGERFFTGASGCCGSEGTGMMSLAPDGRWVMQRQDLFADAFPAGLGLEQQRVLGEIALLNASSGEVGGYVVVDRLAVSAGGQGLFAEDFAYPKGSFEEIPAEMRQAWDFVEPTSRIDLGWFLRFSAGGILLRKADPLWQDFRLEADVVCLDGKAGIQIGGDSFSRLVLWVNAETRQAELDWFFVPPGDSDLEPDEAHFTTPLSFIPAGEILHLSLEVVAGQVRASVDRPAFWIDEEAKDSPWSTLISLGDRLVVTTGTRVYSVTETGEGTPLPALKTAASETRVWEVPGERGQRFGVCLPEINQLWRGVSFSEDWPRVFGLWLGGEEMGGAGEGEFLFPLSFDAGPDGRVFVLDAGNARIQAFDAEGRYLTQWGRQGSEDGEFDFGDKARVPDGAFTVLDFAGSVAVDDQGNIYVADVGNGRIQKFAP